MSLIYRIDRNSVVLLVPLLFLLHFGVMPFVAPELPEIQYFVMALGGVAGIVASLVFREAVAALSERFGGGAAPRTIHLWGGVPDAMAAPAREAQGVLAAVLASLLAATLLLAVFARGAGPDVPLALSGIVLVLILFNILVAVMTLLPFYPLGGGRLLVALIARKRGRRVALDWARGLCLAGGAALVAFGGWRLWGGAPLTGLAAIVLALHLAWAGLAHTRLEKERS